MVEVKRLPLFVSAVALVVLAAPAHADVNAENAAFLAALNQAGLAHRGADRAVAAGRAVCDLMNAGVSPMDTIVTVQSTNPGFTLAHAAKFAAIAVANFCPEHM